MPTFTVKTREVEYQVWAVDVEHPEHNYLMTANHSTPQLAQRSADWFNADGNGRRGFVYVVIKATTVYQILEPA